MNGNRSIRLVRCGLVVSSLSLAGCQRAPSFDVLGSFFPAWLVCLGVAMDVLASAHPARPSNFDLSKSDCFVYIRTLVYLFSLGRNHEY
jgi:hypothetical protein